MNCVFESCLRDISEISRNLSIYILDDAVLLFMESSIYTVCTYSDFFLVCDYTLISDHLRFMASGVIEGF